MTRYWLWWFLTAFGTFIVPETIALVRNRTQDTLSGAIWKLEEFKAGQPITGWSASHLLFTGVFTLMALWLIGHFGFGWWR